MSLEIKLIPYSEIPEGQGPKIRSLFAQYIGVYNDGKLVRWYSDDYDELDASFSKGLKWVLDEIYEAYIKGMEDGRKENKS